MKETREAERQGGSKGARTVLAVTAVIVFGLVVGAVHLTLHTESDCESWSRIARRKAEAVFGALRGYDGNIKRLERAEFKRNSFRINGTLYRNPGGCTASA